jgi:hypothetical protein
MSISFTGEKHVAHLTKGNSEVAAKMGKAAPFRTDRATFWLGID